MAESSVLRFPQTQEEESRELNRSSRHRSQVRETPPHTWSTTPTHNRMVIDRTLATATNLAKLLPTGSALAFKTFSPSFTNKGTCYPSNTYLTLALICLCGLSCIFFSFSDSLIGRDGKLYYGLATPWGFHAINYEGSNDERSKALGELGRFQLRFLDYLHALFSVLLFLCLTFSDSDVQKCLFPDFGPNARELMVNLPLGAGVLASFVFFIFPTSRKGIGYTDEAPRVH